MPATLDEVIDSLLDNADFEEVNSLSKAKAFVTAATRFFILVPQTAADQQGCSQSMSVQQIENLMERARSYVSTNNTAASSVRFLGVGEDFR